MVLRGREDQVKLVTKEELIRANDSYWDLVDRAREALKRGNPDKESLDVDEIHVDPEEDYAFVSWSYYDGSDDGTWCETSTTYRINKFLSLINKEEKVDPNDRIPVKLNGVGK